MNVVNRLEKVTEISASGFNHVVVAVKFYFIYRIIFRRNIQIALPKVTEEPDEASTKENHKIIILLASDFSKRSSQIGNQIVGILLMSVKYVVFTLRRNQRPIPNSFTKLQLKY